MGLSLDGTQPISRRAMIAGSVGALLAHTAVARLGRATAVATVATGLPGPPDAAGAAGARIRAPIDLDRFVADCVAAHAEANPQEAVKEVLTRAVHDPRAMLAAVGEPTRAGITAIHRSPTLTIFSAAWAPQMNLMPHNHRMWALIGIYTGREDNILWQRSDRGVTASGARCLFAGDVTALADDVIHSVTNPLERLTGGIHIYGGDFFATTRSQWNPETLAEEPSDGDVIRKVFERANARMHCLEELGQ